MAKPPIPLAPKKPAHRRAPLLPGRRMPPPPKPPAHEKHRPSPIPEEDTIQPEASGKGPPLFIKIDKYRDVVDSLHKLKSYSLSLRDALDALADIQKELQHGISLTQRALDKFNTTISAIDAKITRATPREVDHVPAEGEMSNYVKDLHKQMERIKKDLGSINV